MSMEGPLSSAESSIHEIVTLVANYRTDEALARSQIAVLVLFYNNSGRIYVEIRMSCNNNRKK